MMEIVAPQVGGITASDGSFIEADEQVDGGPSVLFDAVALLPSLAGATELAGRASAKDFVNDAFAHCKFIAHTSAAEVLFAKAGVADDMDEGFVSLSSAKDATTFVEACRAIRLWAREMKVDLDAAALS